MSETKAASEEQKPTKGEVFGLFHEANREHNQKTGEINREHNRMIREAMLQVLDTDEDAISSVERVMLGLTGSLEELSSIQDLDQKIKDMTGQPVAWIGNEKTKSIHKIATIDGGIEGRLHGNTYGTLVIPVSTFVSGGHHGVPPRVKSESEAIIAHVHYHTSDPVMGVPLDRHDPISYSVQRGDDKMLFGFEEITAYRSEAENDDVFGALLSTYLL